MSTSNQNPPESPDEQRFIQRAMADIDKAEKVQKIKRIVVIGIPFGALLWEVIRTPDPGINPKMVGLGVMTIIVAIVYSISLRITTNTASILRALVRIEALLRNQKNGGNAGS
jgi:hypothetical protein